MTNLPELPEINVNFLLGRTRNRERSLLVECIRLILFFFQRRKMNPKHAMVMDNYFLKLPRIFVQFVIFVFPETQNLYSMGSKLLWSNLG